MVFGPLGTLGDFGWDLYRQMPPIPERVMQSNGETLFTGQEICDGQNVWHSMGGQGVGSVWGHGAYVAPDWSADWLHREASAPPADDIALVEYGQKYSKLSPA